MGAAGHFRHRSVRTIGAVRGCHNDVSSGITTDFRNTIVVSCDNELVERGRQLSLLKCPDDHGLSRNQRQWLPREAL